MKVSDPNSSTPMTKTKDVASDLLCVGQKNLNEISSEATFGDDTIIIFVLCPMIHAKKMIAHNWDT